MKIFLIALTIVVTTCIAALLLGMALKAMFTGQSFHHPLPRTVDITVPFSPLSPLP